MNLKQNLFHNLYVYDHDLNSFLLTIIFYCSFYSNKDINIILSMFLYSHYLFVPNPIIFLLPLFISNYFYYSYTITFNQHFFVNYLHNQNDHKNYLFYGKIFYFIH